MAFGEATSNLKVKITAETAQFDQAMSKTTQNLAAQKKQFTQLGMTMALVGGAITASLGLAVRSYAKAGTEIYEMSQKTGFAAETLSELKYIADQTGGSLQGIEVATKMMSRTLLDASTGSKEASDTLTRLGLTIENLMSLKPEDRFWTVANAISDIEDPTIEAAMATDIFGRSGTNLLPMLSEGADGLKRMKEEAHDLGIIFDEKTAKAADNFGDSITRLNKSMDGLKFAIAEGLTPVLEPLVGNLTNLITGFKDWAKEHGDLVQALTTSIGGLGLFMTAAGAILLLLPKLISGFAGLATTIGISTGALTGLVAGIGLIVIGITALLNVNRQFEDFEKKQKKFSEESFKAQHQGAKTVMTEYGHIYDEQMAMTEEQATAWVQAATDYTDALEAGLAGGWIKAEKGQQEYIASVRKQIEDVKKQLDAAAADRSEADRENLNAQNKLLEQLTKEELEKQKRQDELNAKIQVYNLNLEGQLGIEKQIRGEREQSLLALALESEEIGKQTMGRAKMVTGKWTGNITEWTANIANYLQSLRFENPQYRLAAIAAAEKGFGVDLSQLRFQAIFNIDGNEMARAMVGPLGQMVAQRQETGG